MKAKQDSDSLPALRRGLRILELLAARSKGLSYTDLRERMKDVPDPTLSRLLKVLINEKMLSKEQETGNYQISFRLLQLAKVSLGAQPKGEMIQPILDELAEQAQQSTVFYEFDGRVPVLLAKCEKEGSCHLGPIYYRNRWFTRGALGQICLAFQTREKVLKLIPRAKAPPALPIPEFLKRLEKIRSEGAFAEVGEGLAGTMRIGAAVFQGGDGPFLGTLGINAMGDRWSKTQVSRWLDMVKRSAQRATELFELHAPSA